MTAGGGVSLNFEVVPDVNRKPPRWRT